MNQSENIEIGFEEITVESQKEKKMNSKIYTLLCYFLSVKMFSHMIYYTNDKKGEFAVKLTNKKNIKCWSKEDISLFLEMDSVIYSSRNQSQKDLNSETSTRVRFMSNMAKLVKNGYLKDLGTESDIKSIKLRKYRLLKYMKKDELEERVKVIYSERGKKKMSNKGDERKKENKLSFNGQETILTIILIFYLSKPHYTCLSTKPVKALPKKKNSKLGAKNNRCMVVNQNKEVTLKGNIEENYLDTFNDCVLTTLKNMEPIALPKNKISKLGTKNNYCMVANQNKEVTLKGNIEGNPHLDSFNESILIPLKNMEPVVYIEESKQNDEFGAFKVETSESQFNDVNGSYLNVYIEESKQNDEFGAFKVETSKSRFNDVNGSYPNFRGVQTEVMQYDESEISEEIKLLNMINEEECWRFLNCKTLGEDENVNKVPENANIVQNRSSASDQGSALKVDKTFNDALPLGEKMDSSEMFQNETFYECTMNNQDSYNLPLGENMDSSEMFQNETFYECTMNNQDSYNLPLGEKMDSSEMFQNETFFECTTNNQGNYNFNGSELQMGGIMDVNEIYRFLNGEAQPFVNK